jgi:hypothetical protein
MDLGQGLASFGQSFGQGLAAAMQQYHEEHQKADYSDALMRELSQQVNPTTGKPVIDKSAYEDYLNHSMRQRSALAGAKLGALSILGSLQKAVGQVPMPVRGPAGEVIGERTSRGLKFYPQDIRHPEYAQTRELAAVQKPLYGEIKQIQSEFQKNYKITPETFLAGGGVEVTPGEKPQPPGWLNRQLYESTYGYLGRGTSEPGLPTSIRIGEKTVDAGTIKALRQRAGRYQNLKQAVTAPDPMKVLAAMDWVQKNPKDPRAAKWQAWIQSQVGSQGPVAAPPQAQQTDETPEEPPEAEEPE